MVFEIRGAVPEALAARFGGYCKPDIATFQLGVTPQLFLPANMDRVNLGIWNFSGNTVVISPFFDAALTKGINVPSLGGFVSFDIYEDTILPAWEWWGIASVAATEIVILSVVRERRKVE